MLCGLCPPRVACVSAPSVYRELRELCGARVSACVFEYDRRFAVYGPDFVFYDYARPLDLPGRVVPHSFDIVVADPPYLSEECLQKTSETIKYLTRGKILLCTGGSVTGLPASGRGDPGPPAYRVTLGRSGALCPALTSAGAAAAAHLAGSLRVGGVTHAGGSLARGVYRGGQPELCQCWSTWWLHWVAWRQVTSLTQRAGCRPRALSPSPG